MAACTVCTVNLHGRFLYKFQEKMPQMGRSRAELLGTRRDCIPYTLFTNNENNGSSKVYNNSAFGGYFHLDMGPGIGFYGIYLCRITFSFPKIDARPGRFCV
jgi:hypothetical protein